MLQTQFIQSVSVNRESSSTAYRRRALTILMIGFAALVFSSLRAYADHIHHLYYNNIQWLDDNLGGNPFSESAVTAFDTAGNKQLHTYYVDTSLHVHQLYFNNKVWSDQDLTADTGGPNAGIWGISGFADGNLQHVFYVGYSDSHIHELYYNNSNWSDIDVTVAGGGPLAYLTSPNLVAFTTPQTPRQFHVYYEDTNLDVHQLYFNGASWSDSDLTQATGASCSPPVSQFPPVGAGYMTGFAVGNKQHLFCVGPDATKMHLHLIHIYYNNSIWTSEDVSAKAGGASLMNNAVAAFRYPGTSQLEAYGATFDGHVHQYTFKAKTWTDFDVTSATGAPADFSFGGAVGFTTVVNKQFHIYYQPSNEVYQLYFNGTSWSVSDLTGGGGTADFYGSGMAGFAIGNLQHVFYLGN